jgi:hypothetical protein
MAHATLLPKDDAAIPEDENGKFKELHNSAQ